VYLNGAIRTGLFVRCERSHGFAGVQNPTSFSSGDVNEALGYSAASWRSHEQGCNYRRRHRQLSGSSSSSSSGGGGTACLRVHLRRLRVRGGRLFPVVVTLCATVQDKDIDGIQPGTLADGGSGPARLFHSTTIGPIIESSLDEASLQVALYAIVCPSTFVRPPIDTATAILSQYC